MGSPVFRKWKVGGMFSLTVSILLVSIAVALYLYYSHNSEPLPSPLSSGAHEVAFISHETLSAYGPTSETTLALSIVGHVFDVTSGRRFYGAGGPYSGFAGRDATRSFATGVFDDPIDIEKGIDIDSIANLNMDECKGILQWLSFFQKSKKYTFMGYLTTSMYIQYDEHKGIEEQRMQDDEVRGVNVLDTQAYRNLVLCSQGVSDSKQASLLKKVAKSCNNRYDGANKRHTVWCDDVAYVPRRSLTSLVQGEDTVAVDIGSNIEEKCVCVPLAFASEHAGLVKMYSAQCSGDSHVCNF